MDNELDLEAWVDAQMELDNLPGVNDYGDLTFDDEGYYRGVTVSKATFMTVISELQSFVTSVIS